MTVIFQKLQAIYPPKRSVPTMSFYLEFNNEHYKLDKVCAGIINFVFILILIYTSATTFLIEYLEDSKPLIQTLNVPLEHHRIHTSYTWSNFSTL